MTTATDVVSCKRLPYEKQARGNVEDDESSSSSQDSNGARSDNVMNERPMTELQNRLLDISQIIDYLYKLSTKIRDPNMRSRSLRAALYKEVDEETEVELLSQYAIFDRLYTCDMFRAFRKQSSNHEDSFLIDRLSRTITKRRQQFKYWKMHHTKLASGIENDSFKVAPVPSARNQADEGATNQRLAAQKLKPDFIEVAQKSINSETETTMYIDRPADIVSEISVATTAVDMKGEKVELPPPPRTSFGKDFECPYCFIICPFKYSKPRAWR